MKNATLGWTICLSLLASAQAVDAGPISELYVTEWNNGGVSVVQGPNIVRNWGAAGSNEISIAVLDGTVRTYAHVANDVGAEYVGATGAFTGTTYSSVGDPRGSFHDHDGATDGQFFYSVDITDNNVHRFDTDWTNPTPIFNTGGAALGITHDPTNDSLWVGGWGSGIITNYSMTGAVLSSFSAGFTHVGALALDTADQTLWATSAGGTTFFQFDKSGNSLGSQGYAIGGLAYGAEFNVSSSAAVPEPGTGLLVLSLLSLLVLRARRA